jgi:hypothetical protein
MTKASIDLQDLRRRIYVKAKAETSWKFRGLYVHVRAPNRQGFGWARWSRGWLYQTLKLFNGYRVVRPAPALDQAIHDAVIDLNRERIPDPLAMPRISA